jgi:hypothetical protein
MAPDEDATCRICWGEKEEGTSFACWPAIPVCARSSDSSDRTLARVSCPDGYHEVAPSARHDVTASFIIHHSPFIIHHSPFIIHHSPFIIHHSPLIHRYYRPTATLTIARTVLAT